MKDLKNTNNNTIIINLPTKKRETKMHQHFLRAQKKTANAVFTSHKSKSSSPKPKPINLSAPLGDNRFTTVLQQTPQLNRDYLNVNDKLNILEQTLQNAKPSIYANRNPQIFYNRKDNQKFNDNFDVANSTSSDDFIQQGNPRPILINSSSSFRPISNNSIRPTPNYLTQNVDDYINETMDNQMDEEQFFSPNDDMYISPNEEENNQQNYDETLAKQYEAVNQKEEQMALKDPSQSPNEDIASNVKKRLVNRENKYEEGICPICGWQSNAKNPFDSVKNHIETIHYEKGKKNKDDKIGGDIDIENQAKEILNNFPDKRTKEYKTKRNANTILSPKVQPSIKEKGNNYLNNFA